jgi:hypothetical protein
MQVNSPSAPGSEWPSEVIYPTEEALANFVNANRARTEEGAGATEADNSTNTKSAPRKPRGSAKKTSSGAEDEEKVATNTPDAYSTKQSTTTDSAVGDFGDEATSDLGGINANGGRRRTSAVSSQRPLLFKTDATASSRTRDADFVDAAADFPPPPGWDDMGMMQPRTERKSLLQQPKTGVNQESQKNTSDEPQQVAEAQQSQPPQHEFSADHSGTRNGTGRRTQGSFSRGGSDRNYGSAPRYQGNMRSQGNGDGSQGYGGRNHTRYQDREQQSSSEPFDSSLQGNRSGQFARPQMGAQYSRNFSADRGNANRGHENKDSTMTSAHSQTSGSSDADGDFDAARQTQRGYGSNYSSNYSNRSTGGMRRMQWGNKSADSATHSHRDMGVSSSGMYLTDHATDADNDSAATHFGRREQAQGLAPDFGMFAHGMRLVDDAEQKMMLQPDEVTCVFVWVLDCICVRMCARVSY